MALALPFVQAGVACTCLCTCKCIAAFSHSDHLCIRLVQLLGSLLMENVLGENLSLNQLF